jgi:hypothetical protein
MHLDDFEFRAIGRIEAKLADFGDGADKPETDA